MPERGASGTRDREFPPIAELLPHRGRAVLLDRVLAHDATSTECLVDTSTSTLFHDHDGGVPATIGLEYMAQTIAAHGGLLDRAAGRDARPGFFLGTRRLSLAAARFEPGQQLRVRATHLRGTMGLLAFDCAIYAASAGNRAVHDDQDEQGEREKPTGQPGQPMVSGVLTVYLLESFEALARDFAQTSSRDASPSDIPPEAFRNPSRKPAEDA